MLDDRSSMSAQPPPAQERARGARVLDPSEGESVTEGLPPFERAGEPKVRLKSMQMQVREHLVDDIISGVLPPGTRITQAELAERFGVSLAPIREALRELNNEGLVELDPFTGVTVHRPTMQSLENVYEVRLSLEPIAIPTGRVKISDDMARRAAGLIAVMEHSVDKRRWTAANREFHRILRSGCTNGLALQLLQRLENLFDMYVSLSIINRSDANEEHRELLDAYLHGTRSEILSLTRKHIRRTFEAVAGALSDSSVP
jgi:DNA-binding GntR family transcriptional regulator